MNPLQASAVEIEQELLSLLQELSDLQREMLDVLSQKRTMLARLDLEGMAAIEVRESDMLARLQSCHDRRAEMLSRGNGQDLPAENLRSIAATLPLDSQQRLQDPFNDATGQARLLQHHGLTNWVIAQRSLIHIAQVLEIIATNGRTQPTYGKKIADHGSGTLLDQAV